MILPHFSNSVLKTVCDTIRSKFSDSFRELSLFKRSPKKQESPYIIVRSSTADHSNILKVMHESYYFDEPTITAMRIRPNSVMDELALKAMAEGFTLVARCKYDGCIVGACINSTSNPWDPDLKENLACNVKCPKMKQLLMFYAYMERLPQLWQCTGVQKVYELEYVFISKQHRKRGLAYKLMQDSKRLGADCGFGVIRCDSTSAYTAKLCERLKMNVIAEIPYCKYLNADLEPVIQPVPPHDSVKIYADCAPQLTEYENMRKGRRKRRS